MQNILTLLGVACVACVLRWQIGFFTLESIRVGWKVDALFITGCVLIAQRFLL